MSAILILKMLIFFQMTDFQTHIHCRLLAQTEPKNTFLAYTHPPAGNPVFSMQ
jgi:hypothetical protein